MTQPLEESAKAVQEVSKAVGKGLEVVRDAGSFLSEFIRDPLEQRVGIWTDNLRYRRWENQLQLQAKARQKLEELGGPASINFRPIPMRVQVPLLEAASLAEEDELQDRWANLLINFGNSASQVPIERSFISVLRELSPLEVAILDKAYSVPPSPDGHRGVVTAKLPAVAARQVSGPQENAQPTEDVAFALSNLFRLGCLTAGTTWDGGEHLAVVFETTFGRELVRACSLQRPER